MLIGYSSHASTPSLDPRLALLAAPLAVGLLLAAATETEARSPGFNVPRMPRVAVPRVAPGRGLSVPRAPSVTKVPRMNTLPNKITKPAVVPRNLTKPVVGSPSKPVLPGQGAAKQLPSQPAALPKAAKAPAATPKSDRWGWSDCRSRGGVWGANGSCGHPTFGGTQGQRPRLVRIPWFVPIVPTRFVDPLPCPQGSEKVGETFYGGTKCAPIRTAALAPDRDMLPPSAVVASYAGLPKMHQLDCGGKVGSDVVNLPDGSGKPTPNIVLRYEGLNAKNFHWVQFVWREKLIAKQGQKSPQRKDGFFKPHIGNAYDYRRFTTDPRRPNYSVDALTPGLNPDRTDHDPLVNAEGARIDPTYDSVGASSTDNRKTEIRDAPSSGFRPEDIDLNNREIVSKAHFDSFLVTNGKVCAKISWVATYKWQPGDPDLTGPIYTISKPDTSGTPPNADQLKVLNYRYPGQEAIR